MKDQAYEAGEELLKSLIEEHGVWKGLYMYYTSILRGDTNGSE